MIEVHHHLGVQPYESVWERMKAFTIDRTDHTIDQFWLLEHSPVYTQGQAGKAEHLINPGKIPVVQSDRGGQITYHGPGQLVGYVLLDLKRRQLGVRSLVCLLEKLLIELLATYDIHAECRVGAPGVYVENKKIASIGLRVKNHCTYHGVALNTAMDLTPFKGINPCGFQQLEMVQIRDYCPDVAILETADRFIKLVHNYFGITVDAPVC